MNSHWYTAHIFESLSKYGISYVPEGPWQVAKNFNPEQVNDNHPEKI